MPRLMAASLVFGNRPGQVRSGEWPGSVGLRPTLRLRMVTGDDAAHVTAPALCSAHTDEC